MSRPDLAPVEGAGGLVVTGLRKSYRRRPVIRDVSLRLGRGEVVALLGPNGSGKTTSFYCIAGLVAPEGGTIAIDGRDATGLPMYRRAGLGIGYLPQEMSIFRGLSVEDNIRAILEIAVPSRAERSRRLERLLTDFGIEHLRRAPALAPLGRRAAAGRDRALPRLGAPLPAAGRALRRGRSDRGGRHPHAGRGSQDARHRPS